MDNRISDKDLEFVSGGVNNSEEAISGAIGWLQEAVATCAQLQSLSINYEPRISGLIQRLQSCNGDSHVIRDVVNELSRIIGELNNIIANIAAHLPDAERLIYGNVHYSLTKAINQLS